MLLSPDGPHLTYCSNIHPGETWTETRAAVLRHVPEVRDRVAPGQRFGVGLRLSNNAVSELVRGDALPRFRDALAALDLYVFTLNGFPYGRFHGTTVKAEVYRPDWQEHERELYTHRLTDALEGLLPEGVPGSISTVPGCFSQRVVAGSAATIADALRRQAADLSLRQRERGVSIALALEPEPCCALETIDDTISFFNEHMFVRDSVRQFATLTGLAAGEAELALRRHIGVCLDTCHAAVEFEDPRAAVTRLRAAGIGIPKVQLTTGVRVTNITATAIDSLRRFADDVYLHQVVARGPDGLSRHLDLPAAFEAFERKEIPTEEWRVHFHVPVFMQTLGAFENTQPFLIQCLDEVMRTQATRHLELETYTWDVLPPEHRSDSVVEAIARELQWVLSATRPQAPLVVASHPRR